VSNIFSSSPALEVDIDVVTISAMEIELVGYFRQDPILGLLNLQPQRRCCSRLDRSYIGEK
jgi:hypothetical protein